MKILAIEKENDAAVVKISEALLKAEALKVWELVQKEVIREIYFTKDNNCAVLILECADESEACQIINTLPLVKENRISFEIKSLVPYDGFSRLFK